MQWQLKVRKGLEGNSGLTLSSFLGRASRKGRRGLGGMRLERDRRKAEGPPCATRTPVTQGTLWGKVEERSGQSGAKSELICRGISRGYFGGESSGDKFSKLGPSCVCTKWDQRWRLIQSQAWSTSKFQIKFYKLPMEGLKLDKNRTKSIPEESWESHHSVVTAFLTDL